MAVVPEGFAGGRRAVEAVAGRGREPVDPAGDGQPPRFAERQEDDEARPLHAGGMGRRRVLVHSSGFQLSPYSDIKPAGEDTKDVARKLWHRSPGSPG